MLSQDQTTLEISTTGQGLVEITDQVQSWTLQTGIKTGQITMPPHIRQPDDTGKRRSRCGSGS